jgi:hypothetical protein
VIAATQAGEEFADAFDLAAVAEEDVEDRAAAVPAARDVKIHGATSAFLLRPIRPAL